MYALRAGAQNNAEARICLYDTHVKLHLFSYLPQPETMLLECYAWPQRHISNKLEWTMPTDIWGLGEYLLRIALGQELPDPRPEMEFYNAEMQDCAEGYRDMVLEQFHRLQLSSPDAVIYVEQEVDFSEYVPGAYGTSDCICIGDGRMLIIDYKHGKGVPVSAEDNTQLKCYAEKSCQRISSMLCSMKQSSNMRIMPLLSVFAYPGIYGILGVFLAANISPLPAGAVL